MKILVVDDHALVREGLCQVLKALGNDLTILQAATCGQAFALTDTNDDIDLVLLDYMLPDMNGLNALAVFGQNHPELPVLLLSGTANERVMRQVLQAGAAGFLTKNGMSEELLHAVRQVLQGDIYVPKGLGGNLPPPPAEPASARTALTQRQERVLCGLLDGNSNRDIADMLHVSEETVKTHITAILRHFDVQNRTQAVVAAARAGYRPLQVRPANASVSTSEEGI